MRNCTKGWTLKQRQTRENEHKKTKQTDCNTHKITKSHNESHWNQNKTHIYLLKKTFKTITITTNYKYKMTKNKRADTQNGHKINKNHNYQNKARLNEKCLSRVRLGRK